MEIGTQVKVKPPFELSFPDIYTVVPAPELEEGQEPHPEGLVWLEGAPDAWSPEHLEAV